MTESVPRQAEREAILAAAQADADANGDGTVNAVDLDNAERMIRAYVRVAEGKSPRWAEMRDAFDKEVEEVDRLRARVRALSEALAERQGAIDFAVRTLRSSEYVGGPSQRDAWRLAEAALTDVETDRQAANPPLVPVEGEAEATERETDER